jgi:hypothetical protein
MTRAWQPPGQVLVPGTQLQISDLGGQLRKSAQIEALQRKKCARRAEGDDKISLQQFRPIDWGNTTEADMCLAAEAGISSKNSPLMPEQAEAHRLSADKSGVLSSQLQRHDTIQ